MNESNALDLAAIERLRKLGGDKFAGEMIDLFLTFVGGKIVEARQAQLAGNLAAVAAAAHAAKSSAGNVGAVQVQAIAAQAERSAKDAAGDAAAESVAALEHSFAEVKPLLEAEKAKLKPA